MSDPAPPPITAWTSAVLELARPLGTIPRYGSRAHRELDWSDPRFVAAVAIAAACWGDHTDPERIRSRLRLEVCDGDENAHRDAQEVVAIARRRPIRTHVTRDQFPGPAA